jgi:hypothetical protein
MRQAKNAIFRVAQIYSVAGENGLHLHVMIAPNAECWQVMRNQTATAPVPWNLHDIVCLPVARRRVTGTDRTILVPRWELVGAKRPVKFDLSRPFEAVSLAWSEEIARLFVPRADAATWHANHRNSPTWRMQ